jgi:hypothetical protein
VSFIQNLFTSRDNNANGANYVGQQARIWWNPDTNAFYYSDGNTAGGIPIGTASGSGIPVGPINSIQLNAGGGNFYGASNLTFASNVLTVVGNATADYFIGNGSQLTGVVHSLGNAFATVTANGVNILAGNANSTVSLAVGNNIVITGNATTNIVTIAVADDPVFSGNVTSGNIIANAIVNNGSGNIYHTGNLLPSSNVYNLGLPTVPWANAYFGPLSITILDESGNIGNSVVIENIAANIVIGTTGFTINEFGTTNPIFRIEALTGQIFSNAKTIIQNTTNADNTFNNGALQVKGGASVVKDLYVGGNIYGLGDVSFTGNVNLGAVGNIQITGGTAGQAIESYGNGRIYWGNTVNQITAGNGISISAATGNITLTNTGVLGIVGTTNQISITGNVGNVVTLGTPQDIAPTSNVQFNNLTVNNLSILGNVSNVQPIVVNGKILYVANTATTYNDINNSGLSTGNISNNYYASILYQTSSNTWQMDIGNSDGITAGNIYTSMITANGSMHLGNAYNDYDFPDALLQGDINIDSYAQYVLHNHSQTANASSDFVAVSNNGSDSAYYIDMGINSNVYANVDYAITGYNDGYLYVNGGNLVIGTQTAGKYINFFTGGTSATSYIRAQLLDTSLVMKNTSVLVQDGSDNSVIELQTNGNIVFNGSATLNLTSGFHVSTVNTNNGDSNIVNYVGGQFVYGPALKDYAGNLKANVFSATGNVTAANFNTTGRISATGNIVTAANIVTPNSIINSSVSTTGNVYGNYGVFSGGNTVINSGISTTGNVTGNFILGNGRNLTGVITSLSNAFGTVTANGTSLIANTSSSTLVLAAGNNIVITGNAANNTATVAVKDAPAFSGNVSGANINTLGTVSTAGNVAANNVVATYIVNSASFTGGLVSVTGNVTAAGGTFGSGNISTTGNIQGGNFVGAVAATTVSASGNVTANNGMFTNIVNVASHTGTVVSVTGNVTANNVIATTIVNTASFTGTTVSVTGNVTANNFIGNGAALTATTGANVTGTVANATSSLRLNVASSILAGNLTAAINVAKNSRTTLTYTITGLTTSHNIVVTPATPMPDSSTFFTAAWASAANTVSLQFVNSGAVNSTFYLGYFAFV